MGSEQPENTPAEAQSKKAAKKAAKEAAKASKVSPESGLLLADKFY